MADVPELNDDGALTMTRVEHLEGGGGDDAVDVARAVGAAELHGVRAFGEGELGRRRARGERGGR